ncbi:unnamed protein product, partial [Hapterophycus canaliculatus]
MDPPRRPGSGWLENADRNSKNQPVIAPTPDRSKVTRTIPLPPELIARNEGLSEEEEEARKAEQARKAREDREKEEEELCAICYDRLPNVGRGVIACGHVFCFSCIHLWTKSANRCPGCRVVIRRIIKTMTPADVSKEEARKRVRSPPLSRDNVRRFKNNKQRKRAQRRAARVKHPVAGVVTKCFRVRPSSLKPTPAQQRAAPHPEREARRQQQRQQEQQQRQQQQQQQQQQQARVMQPVQARGALAALAEAIRQVDAAE